MPTTLNVLKVVVFICLFHGKFRRYLKGCLVMQIQLYFPNSRSHLSNCSLAVLAKILGSSLIISSW